MINLQQSYTLVNFKVLHMDLEKIQSKEDFIKEIQRSKLLMDLSGVMYVAVDTERNILFVNNRVSEITEWEREDIIGEKLFDFFLPNEIKDKILLDFKKVLLDEKHLNKHNETIILTKSGKKKTISWCNKLIKNNKGEIIAILSSGIDITERIEAQEQAAHNLNMLETLINSIPDIVCYKDGEGRWLLANKADIDMFSLSGVDYYGKTDAELANYTNPIYKDAFSGCMITDENAWKKGDISNEIEIIPTTNGEEKIFDVYKIPIFKPNGERISLAVIGRDITSLYKIERELSLSQQAAKLGAWNLNLHTNIITISKEFQLLINQEPKEISVPLFEYAKDYILPEDMHILSERLEYAIENINNPNYNDKFEFRANTINLGARYFSVNSNFRTNGVVYGVIQDVTEIKKTEQKINNQNIRLQKVIAEKNKLFSIISHDLRNPFNILIGFSRLLKENYQKYSNDNIEEYLDIINSTSVNTHKLLENILTWSKTQAGQILFEPKEYSIEKIFKENINQVRGNLKQKNIKISYQINKKTIFADKNLLNTILRNLLTNAIKFTQNGGEIILKTDTDNLHTIISVTDNGVGMTKEQQQNIFHLNKYASTKGTNNENGSGLGLFLCKELVKKHKGKIWLESKEGVGSTFFLSIPNK